MSGPIVGLILLFGVIGGWAIAFSRPRSRRAPRPPAPAPNPDETKPWMGTPLRFEDITDQLPEGVMRLHSLLLDAGFTQGKVLYYYQSFGNRDIEYTKDNVRALIDLDRTVWSITLSSGGQEYGDYYEIGLLRYLIEGYDDVDLDFPAQVAYVEANLSKLLATLTPEQAAATARAIETFRQRRVRRLFPTAFNADGTFSKRR